MKLSVLLDCVEASIHALSRYLAWGAASAILLMTLLTFAHVVGRYFLRRPITGSEEITELMMVFAVFLAAAHVASKKGHVRVDVLISLLPRRARATLDSLTSLATAAIISLLVWQIGVRAWDNLLHPGPHTPVLWVPLGPFIMVAAIGCMALCLEFWLEFFHSLSQTLYGRHRELEMKTGEDRLVQGT